MGASLRSFWKEGGLSFSGWRSMRNQANEGRQTRGGSGSGSSVARTVNSCYWEGSQGASLPGNSCKSGRRARSTKQLPDLWIHRSNRGQKNITICSFRSFLGVSRLGNERSVELKQPQREEENSLGVWRELGRHWITTSALAFQWKRFQ